MRVLLDEQWYATSLHMFGKCKLTYQIMQYDTNCNTHIIMAHIIDNQVHASIW